MPFEFKSGERKHPKEFGGSPFKALMAEIADFAGQHRKHSLRRYAGMEKDEEQPVDVVFDESDKEACEACATGECDDPEHMSEEDRGGLASLLGKDDDHDYSE